MKKIRNILFVLILLFIFIDKTYAQEEPIFESRTINISVDASRRMMHVEDIINVENTNPLVEYQIDISRGTVTNIRRNYDSTYSFLEDGEYFINYDTKCSYNDCYFSFINIYDGETPIRYNNLEINIIVENGELYISPYNDFSSFSKQEEDGNIYLSLLPEKDGYLEKFDLKIGVDNPIEHKVERYLLLAMFIFLIMDILIYFLLVKPLSKEPFIVPKEMEEKYKMRTVKYAFAGTVFLVFYSIALQAVGSFVQTYGTVTEYNIVSDVLGVFLFLGLEFIWFLYLVNSYRLYKKLIGKK